MQIDLVGMRAHIQDTPFEISQVLYCQGIEKLFTSVDVEAETCS